MPTYLQLQREPEWGAETTPRRNGPAAKSLASRIRSKVTVDDLGCWRWQLYVRPNGYGQIGVPGLGVRYVHRVAFEVWKGPIPEGLQIDHLCRVRDCCNPDHLEAVTGRVNVLRGVGFAAQHAAATGCPAGHPYDAKNTYWRNGRSGRSRDCRACRVAAHARWRARRRLASGEVA